MPVRPLNIRHRNALAARLGRCSSGVCCETYELHRADYCMEWCRSMTSQWKTTARRRNVVFILSGYIPSLLFSESPHAHPDLNRHKSSFSMTYEVFRYTSIIHSIFCSLFSNPPQLVPSHRCMDKSYQHRCVPWLHIAWTDLSASFPIAPDYICRSGM